jgi:hypothetical protein
VKRCQLKWIRSVSIAFVLSTFTAAIEPTCLGQPIEYDAADLERWKEEEEFQFSFSRPDDIKRLTKLRNIGVLEAILTLEKLSRNEFTKYDDEPQLAAKGLLSLGGGGARGLKLLCQHITMKGGGGSEAVPLDDFFVAQGLVGVGGRARVAIFESLRQPLDRKGLLIRAHVLEQMEPRTIMREYIRLALEDQEEREKIFAVGVNETYKNNLRLIDEWLKDPEFLAHPKNWP